MIKILAEKFWKHLNHCEVAKLLIIIKDPTLLGDKIKNKLKMVNFTEKDLEGIELR